MTCDCFKHHSILSKKKITILNIVCVLDSIPAELGSLALLNSIFRGELSLQLQMKNILSQKQKKQKEKKEARKERWKERKKGKKQKVNKGSILTFFECL